MDNNIEQNIKSLMAGADNTRHVARPLAPYLMSASDLIKADIPPKEFLVSTFMPKASFGMVFCVGILPRKIRHKKERMKDKSYNITEQSGLRKSTVATFVCQHPPSSHSCALPIPVHTP